jgi:uncharacterized protein (TIGR00730 family)
VIFALRSEDMIKKIGVFCSASDTIDFVYSEKVRQFGKWMGETGKILVYGGTALGLMEQMAQAVKEAGGYIIGVLPTKLEENGWGSNLPDQTIHTDNLSERKDIMLRESDVLVALPGGIGTLDEVFHVIAAATVDYHNKKVIFYNINGFYNKLLNLFDDLKATSFITGLPSNYYKVAHTFDELKSFLI